MCLRRSSCLAWMKSRARSFSSLFLTATTVGVGASFGDGTFLGDCETCVLGMWMKAGVSGNGEKWSAIADEDLNARYGRFQTMKLGPSLTVDNEWEETAIRIGAELDIVVCFLLFLLRSTYVSSEPLLVDFLLVIEDRWC